MNRLPSAKRFFTQAISQHGSPERITIDGYPATHTAISELTADEVLPQQTKVRTSKYLNNLIEQDHRRVKHRMYPMLGFKKFSNASVTISGIELIHKIKKGQFDTAKLCHSEVRVSPLQEIVLASEVITSLVFCLPCVCYLHHNPKSHSARTPYRSLSCG